MACEEFRRTQAGTGARDWNSSFVVTPMPAERRGRLYWLGVSVGDKTVVGGSGYYEDIYVKTPDGWRIKQREAIRDSATQATH